MERQPRYGAEREKFVWRETSFASWWTKAVPNWSGASGTSITCLIIIRKPPVHSPFCRAILTNRTAR